MSHSSENRGGPNNAILPGAGAGASQSLTGAQWIVLAAAFLGWMFDGVEIGLFPLVVRPALQDLGLTEDKTIAWWNSVVVACFLLGAAAGGAVFGWMGDKLGRVRSMVLAILAYSLFTGACYFATAPWHLAVFRFIASMGMGGEWALAVALVMECWPERHRPKLAGAIGAAANFGFLFIAIVALTKPVTADSWRWIMLVGASPAVLALVVVMFVPESERWKQARKARLAAPARDVLLPGLGRVGLVATLVVAFVALYGLVAWLGQTGRLGAASAGFGEGAAGQWARWIGGTAVMLALLYAGKVVAQRTACFVVTALVAFLAAWLGWAYTESRFPLFAVAFFGVGSLGAAGTVQEIFSPGLRKATIFAIVFSAIPLMGTWAAVSGWIPTWVDQMTQIEAGKAYLDPAEQAQFERAQRPEDQLKVLHGALTDDEWKVVRSDTARSKAWVQLMLAIGAIIGCFVAPIVGGAFGRRPVYFALCLISLVSCMYLFWFLTAWTLWFMVVAWFVGGVTAAFYGFLPLYLPELFPTRVRATGQGLSFNFGRILAAAGVFYTGYLVALFGDYATAMAAISLVYLVGMVVAWFAPETKGKPLPE